MPDERAAAEAARRKKAAARQPPKAPVAPPATTPEPARRATPLKIVGWVAYLVALVILVVFVLESIHGSIPTSQQLYPLPGLAAAFVVIGVWSVLGPFLYASRSTATRAGKYVLAALATVILFPLLVTIASDIALWIVSLDPSRVH
jgi:hypothetical protein